MPGLKSDKVTSIFNISLFTAYALCVTILMAGMPFSGDDFAFRADYIWKRDGEGILSYWKPFIDQVNYLFFYNSPRLCNILSLILIILPKWLLSTLMGGCWAYAMYSSLKIAQIDIKRSLLVPFALLLWAFMPVWADHMWEFVFEMNYIASAALSCFSIYIIFYKQDSDINLIWMLILGLVLGAWQESYSGPILAGLIATVILLPKFRTKRNLIFTLGLLIGVAYLALCPGTRCRTSYDGFNQGIFYWRQLIYILAVYHGWVILAIILFGFTLFKFRKNLRMILHNPLIIFSLASIVCSMFLCWVSFCNLRSGMWGDLNSIILILYLLRMLSPDFRLHHNVISFTLSILCSILLCLNIAYSLLYGLNIEQQYRLIIKHYQDSDSNIVLMHLPPLHSIPLIAGFNLPPSDIYGYNICLMRKYYYNDYISRTTVKTKELDLIDLTSTSGEPVAGDGGFRLYNGFYFRPYRTDGTNSYDLSLDLGLFVKRTPHLSMDTIRSEEDGQLYEYLHIHNPEARILPIKAINRARR